MSYRTIMSLFHGHEFIFLNSKLFSHFEFVRNLVFILQLWVFILFEFVSQLRAFAVMSLYLTILNNLTILSLIAI